MIDDMLIGIVILDDCVIGQNYLDFLQNGLPDTTRECPFVYTVYCVFSTRRTTFPLYPTCVATSQ